MGPRFFLAWPARHAPPALYSYLKPWWVVAILGLLTACQISPAAGTLWPASNTAPAATFTHTPILPAPTPRPTWTPRPGVVETKAVYFSMVQRDDLWGDGYEIAVGSALVTHVGARPVIFYRENSGRGWRIWSPHDVVEMQYCIAWDEPCALTGEWMPLASPPEAGAGLEEPFELDIETRVDWIGPRQVWAAAQFRDAAGNSVPSFADGEEPAEVMQTHNTIVGVWDEAVPAAALPTSVQTAIAVTRAAFPVVGSVEIEGGSCCSGGQEGDVIPITVAFAAESPFGEVKEMRTQGGWNCQVEDGLPNAAWEPFVTSRTYPVYVALNWIGFYVKVQYRDEHGNLSPVYCDDISIEGHPAGPP